MELWHARLIASGIIVLVGLLVRLIVKRAVLRHARKYLPQAIKHTPIERLVTPSVLIVTILGITSIWGVNLNNLWIYTTSVLGLVAIGFVAVWSILSNLLSSVIIFWSRRIRIGDEIEILPDGIKGKVKNITLLLVVLEEKQHTINIPSNMFFQKFVKIKRRTSS